MRGDSLKNGPSRAPARATFEAIGLIAADRAKPLVAVVSARSGGMPCPMRLRHLAERARTRRAAPDPRARERLRGAFAKYAALVSSASEGAVTIPGGRDE